MQQVVSKSVTVDGGKHVSIEIPRPDPTVYRGWGNTGRPFTFFRDIAVLAVPESGDVDPAKVVDITSSFKDGRLTWDAPAGKWQGKRGNRDAHLLHGFHIPLAEYQKLAGTFNPVKFNADAWAKLAKDSGLQYIVYVSKR